MKKIFIDKSSDVSPAKLRTQCRAASVLCSEALQAVFGDRRSALDVFIAGYFRKHPEFGSRDRQFLSECIYATFRFWGLVRHFIKPDLLIAAQSGVAIDPKELECALLSALKIAELNFAAMEIWQKEYKVCDPLPKLDAIANARRMLESVNISDKLTDADILQEWVAPLLAKEIDIEHLKKSLAIRPPMYLRIQNADPDKVLKELSIAGLAVIKHHRVSGVLCVAPARINLRGLKSFQDGAFEIQDLASQGIGMTCAPNAGERWLDCCAGAGGKSLQLSSLMRNKGTIVAMDIREYKLEDLRRRAKRAGFCNIITKPWDGKKLPASQNLKFDGVLVDAPCSCSGVWRRNVDGRWSLKESEVHEMATLQLEILEKAAPAVKHCGYLVYATCSMFEIENRGVVNAFLATHPEFELTPFTDPLSGRSTNGTLQLNGQNDDCDMMFVARMRRK